ncbi:MAG TPA: hypothetical protein DCP92_21675 [Nitrospiraceae bacterium]|jgi:hypothetical protein|nr:hypothetical protein [Nitrospiraceae bacterium]
MKLVIVTLIVLLPALVYAQPSIVFESETHDFGVVEQGAQLEHVFDFVNSGNEDLVISKLMPS